MHLISASRRTDIPAYYSDWFIDKVNRGFCLVVNPFNAVVSKVMLKPDDVEGIMFWTRNFKPMLKHKDLLNDLGFAFCVQYTLIGYPEPFECFVPSVDASCKTMLKISKIWGPRSLVWRYDPIALSSSTSRGGCGTQKTLKECVSGFKAYQTHV